jgi:hypothetical protein
MNGSRKKLTSSPIDKMRSDSAQRLLDLIRMDDEESLRKTDIRLIRASVATFVVWFCSTCTALLYAPADSFERSSGAEQDIFSICFFLLLLSNVTRFVPLMYRDLTVAGNDRRRTNIVYNGFFACAMTVQGVSMVANGLLAFIPTPVLIDPVTHARVYLVRWTEWFTLGFLLTFLSEEIDTPTAENRRLGLAHSLVLGGSILAGLFCPFISNPKVWWSVIAVSVAAFSTIFVRVYQKTVQTKEIRNYLSKTGFAEYDKILVYTRSRLSLRSMQECLVLWTVLVVLHFLAAYAPRYLPVGHYLNTPALPAVCESFCEVLSKHMHILVLESVTAALSEQARSNRVLQLLRQMMGVVWERSSDTIVISMKGGDRYLCMVSPTMFSLTSSDSADTLSPTGEPLALVFEMPYVYPGNNCTENVYFIRLMDMVQFDDGKLSEHALRIPVSSSFMPAVNSIAKLVEKAASTPGSNILIHDLVVSSNDSTDPTIKKIVNFEVSNSKLETGIVVMVFRDISERVERFEAQKQLAIASTEREKDSQTNRFTRHEIKNGLLSAIELCRALQEFGRDEVVDTTTNEKSTDKATDSLKKIPPHSPQTLVELDTTLHEILDTVLSEAMCRDIIHEV